MFSHRINQETAQEVYHQESQRKKANQHCTEFAGKQCFLCGKANIAVPNIVDYNFVDFYGFSANYVCCAGNVPMWEHINWAIIFCDFFACFISKTYSNALTYVLTFCKQYFTDINRNRCRITECLSKRVKNAKFPSFRRVKNCRKFFYKNFFQNSVIRNICP